MRIAPVPARRRRCSFLSWRQFKSKSNWNLFDSDGVEAVSFPLAGPNKYTERASAVQRFRSPDRISRVSAWGCWRSIGSCPCGRIGAAGKSNPVVSRILPFLLDLLAYVIVLSRSTQLVQPSIVPRSRFLSFLLSAVFSSRN